MDIGAWLRGLGLGQYEQMFRDNGVDASVLPKLTAEDLREIGVSAVGHRRLLQEAIAALAEAPVPPNSSALAATAERAVRHAPERRHLTVMFVDLAGSTSLSARLDPEEMREVLRAYQNAVAGEVVRFAGHVAKFMGDGVLTYFGWPKAQEDAAERAVRAGLGIVAAVTTLRAPGGEPLAARVGIATGLVVVGDLVGEGAAQEEAVVGDTPNLAARLQALAEPGQVVVAEATRRLVGELFALEGLGPQALKGISEPVAAFVVRAERPVASRFEARMGSPLPLVGRAQELALLGERWRQAKAGEGQCVLLVGEAGIGKSRIAQALREEVVGADRPTVLRYQCSPYHTDSALWPVVQQLAFAAGFAPEDGDAARLDKLEALVRGATGRLDEAVPLLAELLGVATGGRYPALELSAQVRRARTLEALNDQLLGLAADGPVLALFEDVHWIDPTTLELIEQALGRIAAARVLLLLTARPPFAHTLGGHPHVTRLALNRLGRASSVAIVRVLSGKDRLPEPVLEEIVAKTDGVPLFVEELTKTVLETGLPRAGEAGSRPDDPPALAIPGSLHDTLMARLDRLPETRAVAQTAACIGRTFAYRLLRDVAAIPGQPLEAALERLVEAELVFRHGTPPEAVYSFKHALVRDAAYASLLRDARRTIHARILEQLDATGDAPPELLARHAEGAGRLAEAIAHWCRAGDQAAATYGNREALAHYRRALRLIEAGPGLPERERAELEVRVAMGAPLIALEGWPAEAVERNYARADAVARALGAHAAGFTARRALWNCYLNRGELARGLELAEGLMAEAETSGDVDELALGCRAVGASRCLLGDPHGAVAVLRRGAALPPGRPADSVVRTYGEDPRIVCSQYLGMFLTLMGQIRTGLGLLEAAIHAAERLRHPFSVAFAKTVGAHVRAYTCGPEPVRALVDEIAALSAKHGLVFWSADARMLRGWVMAVGERREDGVDALRDGLARWQAIRAQLMFPAWHHFTAEALAAVGRADEALAELERALAVADRTGERWLDAEVLRLRGELLLARGRRDEGQHCLDAALRDARERGMRLFELRAATGLARLWREQGKRAEARDLLALVYSGFTEGFEAPHVRDAKALLDGLQ
jgi:class 3 adenylate cyclase/tetratricopeptide (TPR) repeat protein